MKKVMEDEESNNVHAMYFLTTSGLKVNDSQIGSRFWGKVIKPTTYVLRMSEDGGEGRSQLLRVGEEIFGIILFLTQIFGQHVNR